MNLGSKSQLISLFGRLALIMLLAFSSHVVSADVEKMFTTLRSAPTGTDLPEGEGQGSAGGSLPEMMRPDLIYPTLRLDHRELKSPQAAERGRPAPVVEAPHFTLTTVKPAPKEAPKPKPMTDFQKMVMQTLGYSVPIFGANLFEENQRGFEPIDQSSVPSDFILAPGDEVNIHAWGAIDIDYRATIDRSGAILIPKVGEVLLAGVRFGEVEGHIRSAIERSYRGFDLSVSLGQLKSVRVYVTGFAKSPGSYTVNSLSTLVNVLFHAGGPDAAGNMRKVELQRSGRVIATIDLYDFLLHGRTGNDVRMMSEDVIHIPALHGEVAIAGAVNREGIYQLDRGETLRDLLMHGGDESVVATSRRAVIERIDGAGNRVVQEVALDSPGLSTMLQNGDLVLINPISAEFKNAITLRGHVAVPLRHQWHLGMRVSDLIPSSDALISPQYWIRRNSQNQVVHIESNQPATRPEVNFPSINWEYAVIERVNKHTLVKELLPFELSRAVLDRDPMHDLELLPGDHVTVFSLTDFRTRTAQKPRYVHIEGEVLNAGYYKASSTDTITDLVAKAGGLTSDAYLYGMELRREGVRAKQAMRIDESIDQLERDYYRHLVDRSRNVVSGEMTTAIVPEAAAIKGLIYSLRKAEPSGRVVLELPENIHSLRNIPDLVLADGDSLYIPPTPVTVEVVGAVFRQGSFLYNDQRTGDYVSRAGILPTADHRRIYVVRPDGTFTIAHKRVRIRPGDTIIVPEKADRHTAIRQMKDWTQVLYQFGLGAAGLRILDAF